MMTFLPHEVGSYFVIEQKLLPLALILASRQPRFEDSKLLTRPGDLFERCLPGWRNSRRHNSLQQCVQLRRARM